MVEPSELGTPRGRPPHRQLSTVIHLDTSFLIRALLPGSPEDQALREWLRDAQPMAVSTVAWAEFLCGPVDAEQVELAVRVIPETPSLHKDDAHLAAELFNTSGRRRGSFLDCLIAAAALGAGASIATANPADFRRFENAGLSVQTA